MLRLIAVLTVLAALVLVLRFGYERSGAASEAEATLATPDNSDYYLSDATVYEMDGEGALAYRMHLAESLHFPDDSARLRDIDVRYLAVADGYWDIQAAAGRKPADARSLYLHGGVEARHPRAEGGEIVFTTDNAWVYPDRDVIETQAHVVATQPGQKVEGDGLTANLKEDTVRLLNNVQVTYAP